MYFAQQILEQIIRDYNLPGYFGLPSVMLGKHFNIYEEF